MLPALTMAQEQGFKITAQTSGMPDGKMYLIHSRGGDTLAVADMVGGNFVFTGKVDVPDVAYIMTADLRGQIPMMLENAEYVVEAGESLGFLPGDLSQKLNPYLKPLYDAMEYFIPPVQIRKMEESGMIEISPLAYMRGRSLNRSIIILDEAQNTTKGQMKMFLTRLGEDSKAVITGDITQIDLPRRNQSGLLHALSIIHDIEGLSVIEFHRDDIIRSRLVKAIIACYQENEEEGY